jgi:ribonucleoside-diphosphate reductase alpha chain
MNEQRTKVFLDRYARKGPDGTPIETDPSQMWERVALAIADTPTEYDDFYGILDNFKFVPGGRILSGAGTESEVTFYNCYVIPVETRKRRDLRKRKATPLEIERNRDRGCDSREAIFDTIGTMVDIMSRGGGVGINWSVLRPKGAYLKRINGTTSGPVSWMDVASKAVGVVEQGGSRRGAAMFMLDDWHPDLMEFIRAKEDMNVITNANVSVAVSDAFMEAVANDREWEFVFPDTSDPRYDADWTGDLAGWKDSGGRVLVYGSLPAREVWRGLAQSAWASGEPGVVFLDRYDNLSTAAGVERIICVNPCGEQGLGAYSVCNLGAMNLDAYVRRDDDGYHSFKWSAFGRDVRTAVRFLDNVIDKNFYFIPENEQAQKDLRRIGLGVMGLADALIGLGLRYGSPEAVDFTERVFSELKYNAVEASVELAKEKGAAPAWGKEMADRPYLVGYRGSLLGEEIYAYGLRNLFLLTQAPTGTTSILAGVNSGIEPYFAFKYIRKDRTGEHTVYAPAIEKYIPEGEWADYLVTSNDVTVEEHIAMQAAAQAHIDSSVSKTINGPNSHTVDDVEKAYTLAYKSGLKGLAYFRDGSGRDQVLYKDEPKKADPVESVEIEELQRQLEELHELVPYATDFTRPAVLSGTTHRVPTRAGTAYVTVNRTEDSRPVEVFFNVGKAGSDVAAMAEALGRVASLALRHGATLGGVANQLEGVGGASQFNKAIPHAIGEALSLANLSVEKYIPTKIEAVTAMGPDFARTYDDTPRRPKDMDICPECDNVSLVREEGCSKCLSCGFSAC